MLGPIEVLAGGEPLALGGPKPRTLLALLLLARGRPVPTDQLIDELWDEDPPPTAAIALQVHVSSLRRSLGARVRAEGGGYALDAGPEEVDAMRFEAAVEDHAGARSSDPATTSDQIARALALWRGAAFAGVSPTQSVTAAVARLEELRLVATEARVRAEFLLGRHAEVVPELIGLVKTHPTREPLVGALMLALHRSGRDAAALEAYTHLSEVLDVQLGVDPGDEMQALVKAIRRGDPALAAPKTDGLPLPLSAFVGRTRELSEVANLLATTRILTLSGAGGCGKTRLALQVARSARTAHPDGIHFVDLAGVSPSGSVTRRVATILGVREHQRGPLADQIIERLQHDRCLLVVDNCEHLAGGVSALCETLLKGCSGLRILATSREALGVAGETVWTVPGLAVSPPGSVPTAALECDAVRLLALRGGEARAGFGISIEDAQVAAAICRRLDGLPLAVELAAAGLRALSLTELAAHLDGRLSILEAGGQAAEPRHRTMRAAIDWSHNLLDPGERAVLRRLSVVAGACDLDAALRISADPDGEAPHLPDEALPVLLRLVDRSMVVAEVGSTVVTRYRLLETIREYAAEKLAASGEERRARVRHADCYRALAESTARLGGPDHHVLLARLDADINNVRAALAWTVGEGHDADTALAMAAPLWWFWWWRGLMSEGRAWLGRALTTATEAAPQKRVAAMRAAAALARNGGDYDEAYRLGEEALAIARTLGDPSILVAVLNNLCITTQARLDLDASWSFAEESRRYAEQIGDHRGMAAALNNGALALRGLGRLGEAEVRFMRGLKEFRRAAERRGEAAAVCNLAIVARLRGDLVTSREQCISSLALYRDLDLEEGMLDAIEAFACLEVSEDRPERGLRLLLVAGAERERLGSVVFAADEVASRDTALAAAVAALGDERVATIRQTLDSTNLATVVAELLDGQDWADH